MVSSSQQEQNKQQHHLSVYRPPSKPAKKPPTSAQPKVYNVKPIHFRELVQRLTGAGSSSQGVVQAQRLQSAAPPPIQLNSWKNDHHHQSSSSVAAAPMIGDLGMDLSLSPTSCSWFSFPLLSPGPLSNYGA